MIWQGLQESKSSEQLFDRELRSWVWQLIWQLQLRKQHMSGEIVFAVQRASMCVEHRTICDEGILWESIWNRCLWFPPLCTNDVLRVIWDVYNSGSHCLLWSVHFKSSSEVTGGNLLWPRRAQNRVIGKKKTAGRLMVEMKETERKKKDPKRRNKKRQTEESFYLWRRVQQSLKPRSPSGTEWRSGKGPDLSAGRCLAGRIPQSAGDLGAWQTPLLKCRHCVSEKQEKGQGQRKQSGSSCPPNPLSYTNIQVHVTSDRVSCVVAAHTDRLQARLLEEKQ